VAWRHRGTLWGLPLPVPGDATVDCPLRFAGQQYDPETGLHYNNQRYYDPTDGRYRSPDPLGLAPAPNHHAYVANPLDLTDPLGLGPAVPCGEEGRGVSRADAKRKALDDAGVPEGAEPLDSYTVPSTDKRGKQNLDENYQPVNFPEEVHLTRDGELVVYQDHYTGHDFGEGGVGDQPPHVHVRPFEDDRGGVAPGAEAHYYYDPGLG
jgi:RHS repeat-associated protein